MKIIFLDIDGVLNSERSTIGGHHRMTSHDFAGDPYHVKFAKCTIDPIAVELVNKILRDFQDCNLVLSSTHRMNYKDGPDKLEQLQNYLTFLGLYGSRLIAFTPVLNRPRGEEIKWWLDSHPEVDDFTIIDDSSDMLEEQKRNFVHVDSAVGLSANDYRAITKIFGKEDTGLIFL